MNLDPSLDPKLSPEQADSLRMILHRTMQLVAAKTGMSRTCLSCGHFNEASEQCTFYTPSMRPPARIIVEACPAWEASPGWE